MTDILTTDPATYELKTPLGEGLNSCVYKAIRRISGKNMDQQVALKLLKPRICVQRWRQEVENLIQVKSPYCASILGWESFGERSAIVLEYIDGITLKQLILEQELTVEEWKSITYQAQEGLKDLQACGLFHGDINASNLMIDRKGQLRWIDFGYTSIDGMVEFTPDFAAPELFNNQRPSFKSDLYSLGSMIRQLTPFSFFNFDTTLCRTDPLKRTVAFTEDAINGRKSLGYKVRQNLKADILIKTTQIIKSHCLTASVLSQVKSKFSFKIFSPLIIAISILMPFSVPHAAMVDDKGFIVVTSQHWLQVWVDGVNLGYAPILAKKLKTGRHKFRWKSPSQSGQTVIQVIKNQVLVLNETSLISRK